MMSMLNQAAVEALCSATYLENYLDCMENLPDDLQRNVTQLRELDSKCNELVTDISHNQTIYLTSTDAHAKKRALIQIQRALIRSQELGDEKLGLVGQIMEHIENRTRQLEQDLENLDPSITAAREQEQEQITVPQPKPTLKNNKTTTQPEAEKPEKTTSKRQRRQRTTTTAEPKEEEKKPVKPAVRSGSQDSVGPSAKNSRLVISEEKEQKPKKKKKRKAKKEKEGNRSPNLEPIDPDEPTYCLCEQVSYGEMIGCDNDDCPIEWFHFNCVNLTHKPKGKWYCPKCRGDKANVKRADIK